MLLAEMNNAKTPKSSGVYNLVRIGETNTEIN
jgi:hypothetical protein